MVFCCNRVTDSDGAPPGRKNGLVQKSDRKCRDVLCLLFFIVYWVGMVVVAIIGMKTGKPLSLVYGRDYNGSVCGDGTFATRKFTAYPRLNDDMITAVANHIPLNEMPLFGVCVDSCPLTGSYVCTYDNRTCWLTTMDTIPVLFRCLPMDHQNETIISQECLDPPTADPLCTLDLYLQKKCSLVCKTKRIQKNVWDVEATTPNPLMDQLQGHLATLGRFVSDTHASSKLILIIGGGGAMLLGIIWLVILQFFAGCMIWLTCWLVVLVLVVMSLFCSVKSGLITIAGLSNVSFLKSAVTSANVSLNVNANSLQSAGDQSSRMQFEVAAYVLWVLTAVVVLLLIAMRKRIHIAIAIVREASTAIKRLPLLLLWPLVPTGLFILLTIYAMAIAAYLFSSSDLSSVVESTAALAAQAASNLSNSTTLDGVNDKVKALPSNKIQQLLLGFHLFGFLWTNQLIQAISITTIAGAIAQYYWTVPDGNNKRNLEARFPIVRALRNVLRFSLGSLCFGSFIIALVQFARIILEYIDRQTKQLQNSNAFVKVAFLAVRCCLWCFEKCLKFLSKNAYIIIAMRGTSFCSASFDAFKLIFKNLARVAVVNSISFFLLFLVKITITLAVGSAVFVILGSASTNTEVAVLGTQPVTSPMAPVLISCVLAWLVASAFTNVYDAAIDTILLCFCEDIELNGEGASDFMSDELRRIMGDTGGKRRDIQADSASPGAGEHQGSPNTNNKVYVDNNI